MECDYTGEYFQFQVCHVYDSFFVQAEPAESVERSAKSADRSVDPPEYHLGGVPADPRKAGLSPPGFGRIRARRLSTEHK